MLWAGLLCLPMATAGSTVNQGNASPRAAELRNSAKATSLAAELHFSAPAGFYGDSLSVEISTNSAGATVRYTVDGSEPTEASAAYSSPIPIIGSTVVRARGFIPPSEPGPIATRTYFVARPHTVATVSLSTTPANLWSEESGIYTKGPNAESEWPHLGANYWQDWERPVHMELFEPDGRLAFGIDAGMKIHGDRGSRANPQKSLSIFARARYGVGKIHYPIFSETPVVDEFEAVILRGSGNDWNVTMFRDALMTTLARESGLDVQAYRPAVVYMNGEFWGIHNIREKLNEHYLASHYGVDPDHLDLLEGNGAAVTGDAADYLSLVKFISTNDMGNPSNFNSVRARMDIENFINYQVAEIYFGNTDWPGGNIKFWRPRTPGGRWRWLLYDTDFGFGRWDHSPFSHNTLEFALEPDGPEWPNPPWSTLLLRTLLENQSFKRDFINRFADQMNTVFSPERVVDAIQTLQATLEPEMPAHFEKWSGSMAQWDDATEVLIEFGRHRGPHVRRQIMDHFGLDGSALISLEVDPPGAGVIQLNSLLIETFPWSGQYFKQNPIQLTAVARRGYRFIGWEGESVTKEASAAVELSAKAAMRAVFAQAGKGSGPVVINEINYNSAVDFDPDDWVELYNDNETPIDLSGWMLSDSLDDHVFLLPRGTVLGAGEYLVLCRDSQAFSRLFPRVENHIGDFDFGLSGGGELVRLFDHEGRLVDAVTYDDTAPWPAASDGNGPSLALRRPDMDNAQPASWLASTGNGTPGLRNDHVAPTTLSLYQNYPNPFNQTTAITFDLPTATTVRITVHDILGQEITTISDGRRAAGNHTVFFSDHELAGGTYFYRIQAGGLSRARRMTLVK